jgi:hypothetical protein
MPEHLHLLTCPTDELPDFGKYLARIKQLFSKLIKEILIKNRSQLIEQLTVQERPGKSCFRFWQEGAGYDRKSLLKRSDHAFDRVSPRESPTTWIVRKSCRLEMVVSPLLLE